MLLTLFRCRKNVNVRNVLNTRFNTEATWIDSNLNASSIPSAITFTNTQHVIFYDLIDNLKRDASSDVDVKWSAHNVLEKCMEFGIVWALNHVESANKASENLFASRLPLIAHNVHFTKHISIQLVGFDLRIIFILLSNLLNFIAWQSHSWRNWYFLACVIRFRSIFGQNK